MITFNTVEALYLSESVIEIGATVTAADFVAFEVVIDSQVVGSRLHIKPFENKISVNIQQMVHAALLEALQSFVLISDNWRVRKPVALKCRAALVTNGVTGSFTDSATFKVMLGNINRHSDDFYTDFDDSNSYLSVYPDNEKIAKEQDQFLTWFNHVGAISENNLIIRATGYYDGESDIQNQTITEAMALYDCLIFSVNAANLDLEVTGLKYYTVQLFNGVTAVSPLRTYNVYQSNDFFEDILYFNRFFAPCIFRFDGNWTKEANTDYKRFESETTRNQQTQDISFSYTAQSGFVGKLEMEAMVDLYEKGVCIWLNGSTFGTLMLLDKKAWSIKQTFQFLYKIVLEMTAAHKEQSTIGKALSVNGISEPPAGAPVPL